MDDGSLKDVINESSRVSAFDLYEDLLIADSNKGNCLSIHEVNYEKKQLQEQNELLMQQLSQATTSLKILSEQNQSLKENFASLLQTAKTELERKNRIISELSGASGSRMLSKNTSTQQIRPRNDCKKSQSLKGRRVDDQESPLLQKNSGSSARRGSGTAEKVTRTVESDKQSRESALSSLCPSAQHNNDDDVEKRLLADTSRLPGRQRVTTCESNLTRKSQELSGDPGKKQPQQDIPHAAPSVYELHRTQRNIRECRWSVENTLHGNDREHMIDLGFSVREKSRKVDNDDRNVAKRSQTRADKQNNCSPPQLNGGPTVDLIDGLDKSNKSGHDIPTRLFTGDDDKDVRKVPDVFGRHHGTASHRKSENNDFSRIGSRGQPSGHSRSRESPSRHKRSRHDYRRSDYREKRHTSREKSSSHEHSSREHLSHELSDSRDHHRKSGTDRYSHRSTNQVWSRLRDPVKDSEPLKRKADSSTDPGGASLPHPSAKARRADPRASDSLASKELQNANDAHRPNERSARPERHYHGRTSHNTTICNDTNALVKSRDKRHARVPISGKVSDPSIDDESVDDVGRDATMRRGGRENKKREVGAMRGSDVSSVGEKKADREVGATLRKQWKREDPDTSVNRRNITRYQAASCVAREDPSDAIQADPPRKSNCGKLFPSGATANREVDQRNHERSEGDRVSLQGNKPARKSSAFSPTSVTTCPSKVMKNSCTKRISHDKPSQEGISSGKVPSPVTADTSISTEPSTAIRTSREGQKDEPKDTERVSISNERILLHTEHIRTRTERVPTSTEHMSTRTERVPTSTEHVSTRTEHVPTSTEHVSTRTERVPTSTEHVLTRTERVPTSTEHVSTRTERVPTSTEHVLTRTERVPTSTEHVSTRTERVPTSTEHVSTRTERVPTSTKHLSTRTERVPTSTEHVSTRTERVPTSTEHVSTRTERVPTSTEHVSTRTERVPTSTEDVSTRTKRVPTSTKHLSTRTERVPTSTEHVSTRTERVPTSTEHMSTRTERVPTSTEHMSTRTERVPTITEHVSTRTERVPTITEHVLTRTERVPTSTEHVSTRTERVPTSTEHVSTRTERVPTSTEHMSTRTEHVPTSTEHVSTRTERVPTSTEHVSTRTERVPTSTERVLVNTKHVLTKPGRVPTKPEGAPTFTNSKPVKVFKTNFTNERSITPRGGSDVAVREAARSEGVSDSGDHWSRKTRKQTTRKRLSSDRDVPCDSSSSPPSLSCLGGHANLSGREDDPKNHIDQQKIFENEHENRSIRSSSRGRRSMKKGSVKFVNAKKDRGTDCKTPVQAVSTETVSCGNDEAPVLSDDISHKSPDIADHVVDECVNEHDDKLRKTHTSSNAKTRNSSASAKIHSSSADTNGASFDAGKSFMHYYRNASLQCLLHLTSKALIAHKRATSTFDGERDKEEYDGVSHVESPAKVSRDTTSTACNGKTREMWLTSLKDCQERRRLRSRWLSERAQDDSPHDGGAFRPDTTVDTTQAPTGTTNPYLEAFSTLSRASSSSSWTITEQSMSDFFNLASIAKMISPIKMTPLKLTSPCVGSRDSQQTAELEHLQRACRRILQP